MTGTRSEHRTFEFPVLILLAPGHADDGVRQRLSRSMSGWSCRALRFMCCRSDRYGPATEAGSSICSRSLSSGCWASTAPDDLRLRRTTGSISWPSTWPSRRFDAIGLIIGISSSLSACLQVLCVPFHMWTRTSMRSADAGHSILPVAPKIGACPVRSRMIGRWPSHGRMRSKKSFSSSLLLP